MWVLRYMGSKKCTILYIMVWVGIFELAVGIVRGNSGQSNLGQSEPWQSPRNRDNKIEISPCGFLDIWGQISALYCM